MTQTPPTDPQEAGTIQPEPETEQDQTGPGPASQRSPDPGSGRSGLIALLLLIPILLFVVIDQQSAVNAASTPPEAAPSVTPPSSGDVGLLISKVYVKLNAAFGEDSGVASTSNIATLDSMATTSEDRIRTAIVMGELVGPDAALERLTEIEAELLADSSVENEERNETLLGDIEQLIAWYTRAEGDSGAENTAESEFFDDLKARHGWYSTLASIAQRENSDVRDDLTAGGGLVVALMLGGITVFIFAFVAGIGLLIVAVIFTAMGKLPSRFVPPIPGGSVYLETLTVFVAAFASIKFASALFASVTSDGNTFKLTLLAQWAIIFAVFWPLIRGVSLSRWSKDMGLALPETRRVEYIVREIGAGLLGYLASVPVYVFAAIVSVALVTLRSILSGATGEAAAPPSNPIIELVAGTDIVALLLLLSLATVWAPIAEELVMRGALFRHLRSRMHFVIAGPLSALVFGVMHQYDALLLGPVIALGFMFALMRQWRGSLIACITAHFVHNATIMAIVVTFVAIV